MSLGRKLGIGAIVLLATGIVCWFTVDKFRSFVFFTLRGAYLAVHPPPHRCKERAVEFKAKVALMQRDAKNALKIGTKKDDVVRFFATENVPLTFDQIGQNREARGTLYFKGLSECENVACGDDSALIGVRVTVDIDGTVVSDPVVVGMYTNCV
jgi:hypothetical protein